MLYCVAFSRNEYFAEERIKFSAYLGASCSASILKESVFLES